MIHSSKENLKDRLARYRQINIRLSSAGSLAVLDVCGLSLHPFGEQRVGV
jgi:hypothetical protein